MDLNEWMRARGLVDQDVADSVGLSRGYFNRVRNGEVHINLATALAILDFTDDEVGLESLLPKRLRPWVPRPVWRGTVQTPAAPTASKSRAAA